MTEQVMADADGREGHDRALCGARKRQGEGNCTRPAGWGTNHAGTGRCKLHGGKTRTQQVGAQRQAVEQRARLLLADMDVAPVTDPLTELQQLAGEVLALKDAAARLVQGLDDVRYESVTGQEQLRAEVGLYERAVDRAGKVLTDMVRAGIEERQTRLAEAQAAIIFAAVTGALADAGVTGDVAEQIRAALAVRLRAVSSSPRQLNT